MTARSAGSPDIRRPIRDAMRGMPPAVPILCLLLTTCTNNKSAQLESALAPHEFIVELGPVDLPASGSDVAEEQPKPMKMVMPVNGWMHGFTIELLDKNSQTVPQEMMHHVRLISPNKRDLFTPVMLRVVGAGSDTRSVRVPRLLGYPLHRGDSILMSAMLHNTSSRAYKGVRVRVRVLYSDDDTWPSPLTVYPFFMHAVPPGGDSEFDVPPGHSEKSWESSPAIDGRILGIGGHLHRYGSGLRFEDVTAGKMIWETTVSSDTSGNIIATPRTLFLWRAGVPIYANHTYRVTAIYDNPTGDTIRSAMGTVGGMFKPGKPWPGVDHANSVYAEDMAEEYGFTKPRPMHDMGEMRGPALQHGH
jgi:hypothetical protein